MRKWLAIFELFLLLLLLGSINSCGGGSSSSTNTPMPASVVATIPVGTSPGAIDLNPSTNRIYVVNANDQPPTVSVIDGGTNSVIATVPTGSSPCAIAVNAQTNKIYVTNQDIQALTVIDGITNQTSTVTVGDQPCQLAVNSATNKIYVVNSGSSTVSVIDGATNVVSNISVATGPSFLAVNPVANQIYVSAFSLLGQGNVSVIDDVTNQTTNILVNNPLQPGQIAVNATTNEIFVSLAGYHVTNVLFVNGTTLATSYLNIDIGPGAQDPLSGIAVNSSTNKVYAPRSSGAVAVIDGATQAVTTVQASATTQGVVVDATGNQIYVVSSIDGSPGTVTVIDGASNATTSLPVGINPVTAVANSATNRVYVTNSCGNNATCTTNGPVGGTVTVIEGAH